MIRQDCPGATVPPQSLLSEKYVPSTVMLSMVRLVLRLLVRVVLSGKLQMHMFLTGSS